MTLIAQLKCENRQLEKEVNEVRDPEPKTNNYKCVLF
jgi:hypothetical protein